MKEIKIAHFISDEKFPDSAWDLFEMAVPGANDFYMISEPKKMKYIKKVPVKFIRLELFMAPEFIERLKEYSFVVLHALTIRNMEIVCRARQTEIKFVFRKYDRNIAYKINVLCKPEKKLLK